MLLPLGDIIPLFQMTYICVREGGGVEGGRMSWVYLVTKPTKLE